MGLWATAMVMIVPVPPPSVTVATAIIAGDLTKLTARDLSIVPVISSFVITATVKVQLLLFAAAIPITPLFVVVVVVAAVFPLVHAAMLFPVIITAFIAIVTPVVVVTVPLQLSWHSSSS